MARQIVSYQSPVRTHLQLIWDLNNLLQADGRTFREIFNTAGIAPQNFSHWKAGRSAPKLDSITALAEVLGFHLVLEPIPKNERK